MKVREAVGKVRAGEFPATVILHGEEEYIRRIGLRELVAAADVEFPELNVMTFEGRPPMEKLRDALGKPPFMAGRKAVVLRNTDLFAKNTPGAQSDPIRQMVVEDHTLFVIDAGEKLDQRKGAVRHLLENGMLVECAPLKGEALHRYASSLARQRGLHISENGARSLAERCGEDLLTITTELDKLRFVCRGEITSADLDRYCRPLPEAGIYKIQDLLLGRRYESARRAVDRMTSDNSSPVAFLTMLANALRQMLIARTCRDARFPRQKTVQLIMRETGARDWMARRAYEKCVHLSADAIRRGLRRLSVVDFGAKQGRYNLSSDLFALLCSVYGLPGQQKNGPRADS